MAYVNRRYYKLTATTDNGEVIKSMVFDTEDKAICVYNDLINDYNKQYMERYGDTLRFCENYYCKHPLIKDCRIYPAEGGCIHVEVKGDVNFTKAFGGLPMVIYSKVTNDGYVLDFGYSPNAGFFIGYTSERKESYFMVLNNDGYDLLSLQVDMKKDKNWYC